MSKTCQSCGAALAPEEAPSRLCEACRWDRSFEVTSEWGEAVTISRFNDEMAGGPILPERVYSLLLNSGPGTWRCVACGHVRYPDSDVSKLLSASGDASEIERARIIRSHLAKPCAGCGTEGRLHYTK